MILTKLDGTPYEVASATSGVAIVPNDTQDLAKVTKAVYVGVAGDAKVDMADGTTLTFTALGNGIHPLAVKRIYTTGTTATNIVGLY